jgi:hypothetical protein
MARIMVVRNVGVSTAIVPVPKRISPRIVQERSSTLQGRLVKIMIVMRQVRMDSMMGVEKATFLSDLRAVIGSRMIVGRAVTLAVNGRYESCSFMHVMVCILSVAIREVVVGLAAAGP